MKHKHVRSQLKARQREWDSSKDKDATKRPGSLNRKKGSLKVKSR